MSWGYKFQIRTIIYICSIYGISFLPDNIYDTGHPSPLLPSLVPRPLEKKQTNKQKKKNGLVSTVCIRAAVTVHFRKIVWFLRSYHVTISGQRMQCSRSPTWLFFEDSVFANWLPSELSLSSAKWGCSRTGLLVCASCFACLFPLKMDYPNISVTPVRVKWRRSSASFRPYGSKLGRALKRSKGSTL